MEKRLLLSFILSFSILYIWSYFFAPQPPEEGVVISEQQEQADSKQVDLENFEPEEDYAEELYSIEGERFIVQTTNHQAQLTDIEFKRDQTHLPLTRIGSLNNHLNYSVIDSSLNSITYQAETDQLSLKQHYYISQDNFIEYTLTLKNKTDKTVQLDKPLNAFMFKLDKLDSEAQTQQQIMFYEVATKLPTSIYRLKGKSKFKDKFNQEFSNPIWFAFRTQYYCFIYEPLFKVDQATHTVQSEQELVVQFEPEQNYIDPGVEAQYKSRLYYGPQDFKELDRLDNTYSELISFKTGSFFDILSFGLIDIIAKLMLNYMNFLFNIVQNWGFVIILFAITIFVLTYPLTKKSMDSMQKMQKLQPKLNDLKAKHKDDPQQLQMEMMQLYQKEKVNPFGGCLPIFFQMPIFMSLYQLLLRAYQFKGTSFLWIQDLSKPDHLIQLPFTIPYFGQHINILPIIYSVLIFVQQKTQSKKVVHSDPQQAEMQKMMSNVMPFLLGVIFYKFASGLTLYFTMYYLLTTVVHIVMNKRT
jgi:YidC/Oxa1 family membrane protein insertase